ncbi:MAG TPA: helix-turn-helix transcriptional regulator [Candidatus Avacidaminococcus intestinavium]|uniref:Helix-turn-helix transcriptional regulator n=1 Tax=Candidatus Avacidaminococcus intestinavium TaxID=2840684 RepID=A0A9D1MPF1_9FIRM|nr:helix-turn-helix transcriptional regulator [Candidatus Avacidaminococcus intestinavium]
MYGEVLRTVRLCAGLSQEELAFRLNSNQSSISKYENNHLSLDIETFILWLQLTQAEEVGVALLYGVDISTILESIIPNL